MPNTNEQQIDIVRILRRYWTILIVVIGIASFFGFATAVSDNPIYRSSALIGLPSSSLTSMKKPAFIADATGLNIASMAVDHIVSGLSLYPASETTTLLVVEHTGPVPSELLSKLIHAAEAMVENDDFANPRKAVAAQIDAASAEAEHARRAASLVTSVFDGTTADNFDAQQYTALYELLPRLRADWAAAVRKQEKWKLEAAKYSDVFLIAPPTTERVNSVKPLAKAIVFAFAAGFVTLILVTLYEGWRAMRRSVAPPPS